MKDKKFFLFKEFIVVIISVLISFNSTIANTYENPSLNIELIKVVSHSENFNSIPASYGISRSLPPLKIRSTAGKDYVIIPSYKPKIFRLPSLEEIQISDDIYLKPYEVREYTIIGYPYVFSNKFYWIAPNKFSNSIRCDCYELSEEMESSPEFCKLWSEDLLLLDETSSSNNFLLVSFCENCVLLEIDNRLALFDLNLNNIKWIREYEYSHWISNISIVNSKKAVIIYYKDQTSVSVISGINLKTGEILWQQSFNDYVRYGIVPLNIYASLFQNEKLQIPEIDMEPNCFLTFFSKFLEHPKTIRCIDIDSGKIIFEKILPYSEQTIFSISGYQIFDSDFPVYDNKIFFTLINNLSGMPIMYSVDLYYPNIIETYLLEEVKDIKTSLSPSFTSPIFVKEILISWLSKGYSEKGAIVMIEKSDGNKRKYIDIDETFISPSNPLKYGKIIIVNTEKSIYFYKIVY